jgi:hypothetical protein
LVPQLNVLNQQIWNSTILSGRCQKISTRQSGDRVCGGVIITGFGNCLTRSLYSVVSGCKNCLSASNTSVIISGQYNYIDSSGLSIILSSSRSIIDSTSESIIIGGATSSVLYMDQSVIINAKESSIICDPLSVVTKPGKYNTRISSNCSKIVAKGCNSPATTSDFNSIISGLCNSICCSCNVSLIGGTKHLVFANYSSIISGYQNKICPRSTGSDSQKRPRCNNSIIGGFCNCILQGSYDSAIMGGVCNCIGTDQPVRRAVIIGGKLLCNIWNDSTMVPALIFLGNSHVAGLTGLNGTFSSVSPQIKVRGGLAVG